MNGPNIFEDSDSAGGEALDQVTEKRVADRVRSALGDHAARVEPTSNSYLTLSSRLEEEGAALPKLRWRSGRRILAAAAMLLVVAGAGTYALTQTGGSDFEAIGETGVGTSVVPVDPSVVTEPPVTTGAEPVPTASTSPPLPPVATLQVLDQVDLPAADSVAEATAELVFLLGLPGRSQVQEDSVTGIVLPPEDLDYGDEARDPFPELARVQTVRQADGTVASSATSETMQLDEIRLDGDEIVVTGRAIAFEATVEVHLVGTDGTRLASTFTMAGCCEELVPFEARLPMVSGIGEAFVVAHGDGAGSGIVPAFAAIPIRYQGVSGDPTSYSVFRILPDDSDQGLNLRDLPGTDEGEVLATLPSGTSGIQRLPLMPALVGDSFWWRVRTAENLEGWMHSSFLAAEALPIPDAELRELAEQTLYGIDATEFDGLSSVRLSRRVPVALGWIGDPQKYDGPQLFETGLWIEAREWPVPEATYGEAEKLTSLRSMLNLPDIVVGLFEIEVGGTRPYAIEQEMASSYFAGTQSVTVYGPESDDEPRRSMVLFVESTSAGPEIIGVVASIFVP